MVKRVILCQYCSSTLDKDAIGLNKKLFEPMTKENRYMCLSCVAKYLDCTEEDLKEKIEDFKAQGCKLFS